jgi:hypothetical protein
MANVSNCPSGEDIPVGSAAVNIPRRYRRRSPRRDAARGG